MTTYTVCQSNVDIMTSSDFVSGLGLTTDENLKPYYVIDRVIMKICDVTARI